MYFATEREKNALLCEEDRRVYLYIGDREMLFANPQCQEVLLYDFNLPAGSIIRCGVTDFITANDIIEEEFEILEVKEMVFGGPSLHCQIMRMEYPTAIAIEGIGNTCGLLSLPQMVYTSCTGYNTCSWAVIKVTDNNGIVLYERGEADILPVSTNIPDTESTFYDLMGRRIEHPVKGSIYVRQGKKVVF